MEPEIIYEDNSIIVIKKPAGMATQTGNISQKDCVTFLKGYLSKSGSNGKEPYVGIVHRLDQPVAGILVFAKTPKACANLSKQVQSDMMNKCYTALVEGKMDLSKSSELINYMYKDSGQNKSIVLKENVDTDKHNGMKIQKAVLNYTVEKVSLDGGCSQLSIRLVTGRFHQIRAQLSNLGHPILGDKKYGSKEECPVDFLVDKGMKSHRGAIALAANELCLIHPDTGKRMEFRL